MKTSGLSATVFKLSAAILSLLCIAIPVRGQAQSKSLLTLGVFNKYIPAELAKDVWGYAPPGGREYAMQTWTHGMSVLDVTDPGRILEVAFIPAYRTNWKTVKVYKHYAYLGTDNGGTGLQIVDLSGLPNFVHELPAYTGAGFTSTHNIWIDTTRALLYATGTNGQGFRILSLADPEKPVQLYTQNLESHDFFTRGNLMYMSTGRTNQTQIFDVTDPGHPIKITAIKHPGGPSYIHNAVTTTDGNYLFTTEEVVENSLKVWDIRNLNSIPLVTQYLSGNPLKSIAHNVYLKGDTIYVSHYGQGFRVLDVTDRAHLKEIAFYQPQYPPRDTSVVLFGSFAAYVHLPSGNILSSDATLGLFIHKLSAPTVMPRLPGILLNPAAPESGIRFYLGADGPYQVEIRSLQARIIGSSQGMGRAGWNHWTSSPTLESGFYMVQFRQNASTLSWRFMQP